MTQAELSYRSDSGVPRCAGELELPCRVGQWELVELSAEGSLATIYRARPVDAQAEGTPGYAIKMLRAQWHDSPEAVALLRREAAVGRSIAHPNLISVLAARLQSRPELLVMPWLDGATLRQRIAAGQQFDLPEALWFARQTAEGLDALDQAGWMHGDVKPSNLLISPEGHVTLIDLGFARRREETGSAVDRCILGTCNYLAPEWITSALRADIRSDIYSLGVVLFELLSGRLPFTGDNLADVAAQHVRASPPNLARLAPQLPREVVDLVRQMIAKEPLRRPQTPHELIERLVPLEIASFAQRW